MKCIIKKCNEKCINGHTLTKSLITKDLKETINKNDVVYTYTLNGCKFEQVGWKKASTFKFTCAKHDSELFKPIENNIQIDIKNNEHLFLHTFRSFSYVFANKINKINLNHSNILNDVSKFSFNENSKLEYNNIPITNNDIWFQNFIHNKELFLDNLNNKNYKNCNYITFTINKNIGISGCGVLNLPFVKQNGLNFVFMENNIPVVKNPMSILTLLSKGDKTYIILSFNSDYNTEMTLRQLLTINFEYQNKFNIPGGNIYPMNFDITDLENKYSVSILNIISKLLVESCRDNIYIKPSIYNKNKEILIKLFNNNNNDINDYLNNDINLFTLK